MDKIKHSICIIGLGYVGLPLAFYLSKKFNVIAFDTNKKRINQLKSNLDINKEINKSQLKTFNLNSKITYNEDELKTSSIYIVTVPTPITKTNLPDLSNLEKACAIISRHIKKNDLVIFESTVYPGITENYCGKIIEKKSKLKINSDFFLGYSPERVNPGDKKRSIDKIHKIISSSDKNSLRLMKKIYGSFLGSKIIPTNNIKEAEAAKVIENSQRDINIAFINELKNIFDKSKINIYEVLKLAGTKWNFLNFSPGLVGGHCIGVDPYYLMYFAKKFGVKPKLISSSRTINENATNLFVKKIMTLSKRFKKSRILILGCTFKENCPDIRNSKILEACKQLLKLKLDFDIFDPYIDECSKKILPYNFLSNLPKKSSYNLIIIAQKHKTFKNMSIKKLKNILKNHDGIIYDYKNIFNLYSDSI